jgi:hypothetical protein
MLQLQSTAIKEDTMSIFSNKFVVAVICIIVGILVIIGMPDILRWIIGIVLIVYGILVLMGKK